MTTRPPPPPAAVRASFEVAELVEDAQDVHITLREATTSDSARAAMRRLRAGGAYLVTFAPLPPKGKG